jgi:hypothetical protein
MKQLLKKVLVSAVLLTTANVWAAKLDQKHLEFGRPVIEEIQDTTLMPLTAGPVNMTNCDSTGHIDNAIPADPLDQADVWVDKIINIGKKVWAIIEMGRPVVNVKTDTANAMPSGVSCWSQLTNWSVPESKVYKITYKNLYDADVVSFAFRLIYTTGGSYKGVGKYITNATVVPASLNVAWGYTFNASGEVPTVLNMGSATAPVGGMQMNMKWSIDTVFRHSEQQEAFFIGGDGSFKKLD